jgi:hypothetical protein
MCLVRGGSEPLMYRNRWSLLDSLICWGHTCTYVSRSGCSTSTITTCSTAEPENIPDPMRIILTGSFVWLQCITRVQYDTRVFICIYFIVPDSMAISILYLLASLNNLQVNTPSTILYSIKKWIFLEEYCVNQSKKINRLQVLYSRSKFCTCTNDNSAMATTSNW